MYGAILGDMIGCPYEFDRGNKTKDFPLFTKHSEFTDDSVMTIAVAEAFLDALAEEMDPSEKTIKKNLITQMKKYGKRYPHAGYGLRFSEWLHAKNPKPYNSYGNGSAMRVSSVAWLFDSIEEVRWAARLSAEVTHNHPEGIKGAEATASAIFLARTGHSKEEIRQYIEEEFGYDLNRTCDEIRPYYHHVESCQETVPEAITAFLEGEDFEDVIRTAVSLGGDCDTLTAIAGSIAEGFYGVPEELKEECLNRLSPDLREVLLQFQDHLDMLMELDAMMEDMPDMMDMPDDLQLVEEAITAFAQSTGDEGEELLYSALATIHFAMMNGATVLVPIEPPQAMLDMVTPEIIQQGGTVQTDEELHIKLLTLGLRDGKEAYAAFTSQEQVEKGAAVSTITLSMEDLFLKALTNPNINSVVINPFGHSLHLTNDVLKLMFSKDSGEE